MTLKEWLNQGGRKKKWLAQQLGCHDTSVSRWVTGKSVPDERYQAAIEKLTDGQVPASKWKGKGDAQAQD